VLSDSEKQDLVSEIFDLTGTKVGIDDPLFVAVLLQAKSIKVASAELNLTVQQSLAKAQASYTAVIDRGTAAFLEAADITRRANAREFDKMIGKAQGAALGEVPAIKRELEKITHTLVAKLRREGSRTAEIGMSLTTLLGTITLCVASGFAAGYFWFGSPASFHTTLFSFGAGHAGSVQQPTPAQANQGQHK